MKNYLIILLSLAVIASCQTSKKPTSFATNELNATTLPVYPYSPSRTLKHDLLHTKLEVSFDWQKQTLKGKATLTLKPYFYSQNVLELDAKGLDIHYVKLLPAGSELTFRYDKSKLVVSLDKTYERGKSYTLEIDYTAKPNELPKGGNAAINSDKGLFFINADGKDTLKPQQIWTQGEIESSSCWFPTIDSPNEKMTQELYITVDNRFKTLSNGTLVYGLLNADGTRTDLWKHDKPHSPYLVMMAVGDFAIVKDTMPKSKNFNWNGLEVSYYVEPKYQKHAKSVFGRTPEMIEYFSNLLQYKYPWDKYSQVVVRDYVSGAMENTTATVMMEAVQCTNREMLDKDWDNIIAHELFHHWFGDLVTAESWPNLPLNESFANYSEFLWQEHKNGRDAADHHALEEMEGYMKEAIAKQEPIVRFYLNDFQDMFDAHSYNKGGRVLHMLRKYVGDEAFFTSLNRYLTNKEYGSAEIHDLRLAFEATTGEDLNWFFNQWFLAAGHPVLEVQQSWANGKLRLKFTQNQDTSYTPLYRLPMKVGIWSDGKKQTQQVEITKRIHEFEFDLPNAPELVLVDEEAQLLGTIEHAKDLSAYLSQYQNAAYYRHRMQALEEIVYAVDSQATVSTLRLALDDPYFQIRKVAIQYFDFFRKLALTDIVSKIKMMAENDPKGSVREQAIQFLAKESENYMPVFEKAMKDSSYLVQAAGLKSYLNSNLPDTTKLPVLKQFEYSESSDILAAISEYYVSSKTIGKNRWFVRNVAKFNGENLFLFLEKWGEYLPLTSQMEKQESIVLLEKYARNHPVDWIRYAAFKALVNLPETKELRNNISSGETSERLKLAYKGME